VFGISRQGGGSTADLTSLQATTRHGALIGAVVVLAIMAGFLALGSERNASLTLLSVVGATPS
jgi:hypothetical protein